MVIVGRLAFWIRFRSSTDTCNSDPMVQDLMVNGFTNRKEMRLAELD
jgi:hypothetical protein